MTKPYCCDVMNYYMFKASTCPDARRPHDPKTCEDVPVMRTKRTYFIPSHDFISYDVIKFCPWCGTKLSTIKRGNKMEITTNKTHIIKMSDAEVRALQDSLIAVDEAMNKNREYRAALDPDKNLYKLLRVLVEVTDV